MAEYLDMKNIFFNVSQKFLFLIIIIYYYIAMILVYGSLEDQLLLWSFKIDMVTALQGN